MAALCSAMTLLECSWRRFHGLSSDDHQLWTDRHGVLAATDGLEPRRERIWTMRDTAWPRLDGARACLQRRKGWPWGRWILRHGFLASGFLTWSGTRPRNRPHRYPGPRGPRYRGRNQPPHVV